MVLNDGRVIEESYPEVTVDTVEDTQTHEDSGGEEDAARRRDGRRQIANYQGNNWQVARGIDHIT